MLSFAEENYLKTIYHLSASDQKDVSTNAIAEVLQTKPASVTDMIRKLSNKSLVNYRKYHGVSITEKGEKAALSVVRKHRLWEVFLVDKLKFNWDEVHEVAEQLEHIKSPLLIQRLDEFLNYPKHDPHGDPIPNENGEFQIKPKISLSNLAVNGTGIIVAVNDSNALFLQYLDKIGAYLGAKVRVLDKIEFDNSLEIKIDNSRTVFISKEVSENILVTE